MYTFMGLSLTIVLLLDNPLSRVTENWIIEITVVPGANFAGDHVGLKGLKLCFHKRYSIV